MDRRMNAECRISNAECRAFILHSIFCILHFLVLVASLRSTSKMRLMGRLGTAFRAFFRALKSATFAEQVRKLLDASAAAPQVIAEPAKPAVAAAKVKPPPARSEALTLLAVLQREARLIDFLKENVAGYSDDQIGAAVREIHRDAAAALDRMFALQPVRSEAEGATITVPAGFDAGRIRLVGNVTGTPPHSGTLAHAGWEASKVELPEWTGTEASAKAVAPAEVELR
jgi:hypothetical protein